MSQLRNKFLKLFLAAGLILGVMGSASAVDVSTCSEFNTALSNGDEISLTNDIDCQGFDYTQPSSFYAELINGNGYTISNLKIDEGGLLYKEKIAARDLTIDNATVTRGSNSDFTGFFFSEGSFETLYHDVYLNDVTIKNSYFEGVRVGIFGGSTNMAASGTKQNLRAINNTVKATQVPGESLFLASGIIGEANSDMGTYENIDVVNNTFVGDVRLGGATDLSAFWSGGYEGGVTNARVIGNRFEMDNVEEGSLGYTSIFYNGEEDGPFEDIVVADNSISSQLQDSSVSKTFSDDIKTNVYYDTSNTVYSGSESGVTGISNSEISGSGAVSFMNFNNNVWADTNSYPVFLYTLSPTATLESPESGTLLNTQTSTSFEYSYNSGGQNADYNLIVEYPDSSTVTKDTFSISAGNTGVRQVNLSFSSSGQYSWYVENSGELVTNKNDFNVVDYTEPTISLNSPFSETVKGYSSSSNVDFQFDISNADLEGDYFVYIKNSSEPSSAYKEIGSGTFPSGTNSFSGSLQVDFVLRDS